MKKTFICFALASLFLQPALGKTSLLKSFRLIAWDNACAGTIDSVNHTITVKHLSNGQQVRNVDFETTKGTTISPNLQSWVGNWPTETTFTLKHGKQKETYKVVLSDAVNESNTLTPDTTRWKMVWNDEFNDTFIDWNVWSKVPRNKSNWNQMMTDFDDLYALKDGKLVLYGEANTRHPEDSSPYLTGGIWGLNKRSFSLGRIDIRARFTSGKGYWPAIWLLPQDNEKPYSEGGEMDIVEHLNFDDFVYQTAHTRYTNLVNKTNPKNHTKSPVNADEYNVFSVEVFQDRIVYLVNNREMYTYPRIEPKAEYQFPFSQNDYYLILSSQLGGDWVGQIDLQGKRMEMDVDWVRVYQPK